MARLSEYSPVWIYRASHLLDKLPVPAWITGIAVIIIGGGAMHLEAWRIGIVARGAFQFELLVPTLFLVLIPWLWIYLSRKANIAIEGFLKSQQGLGEEKDLANRFLSIPNGLAVVGVIGGIFTGFSNFQIVRAQLPYVADVLPVYTLFSFLITNVLILLIIFRAITQGTMSRQLYEKIKVSIYNPTPIYSLSRYASQSSLAIMFLVYGLTLVGAPGIDFLLRPSFVVIQLLMVASLIFVFFIQLNNINKRMRAEKDRVLSELGLNLEKVYAMINDAASRKKFSEISDLRTTASALREGWDLVKRIPTWPWEPETLRNVLFPLMLPVLVYLLQRFAAGFFGL